MSKALRVLNVGGGPCRDLPSIYRNYRQEMLDIDPAVKPDIVCDAKKMGVLPARQYDAVYCSHTLEHFYKHEVPQVLSGFLHVLKLTGFVNIAVPDMNTLFNTVVKGNHDIDEKWYMAGPNAISFHDVIYGWGAQVAQGNLYYCHKTGFTQKSLAKALRASGFMTVMTAVDGGANLHAFAFKLKPSREKLMRLGL